MIDIIKKITAIVGDKGIILGDDVANRPAYSYGKGQCQALAIVRPASTEELSKVMSLCHQQDQTTIPWGGLTGLVNGTYATADDIAISLERMTQIESIDNQAGTMTVQAGVPLQVVQEKAATEDWLFALDLGARGSATIGGNIATNAGGNSVLKYGMMREQVLGLEAVLVDGTVISSLNSMLKNNAGYDLKQLFIGTEGTLGIVTKAVLRLHPLPSSRNTAIVAATQFDAVAKLLKLLNSHLNGQLSAFEVMWGNFYQLMTDSDKHNTVIDSGYPYYVLIEATGHNAERDAVQFEEALMAALEQDILVDAAIAKSESQREQLWAMRDDIDTVISELNPLFAFDISLPIANMEQYIQQVESQIMTQWPHAKFIVFGHLGDGNLHLGICVGSYDEQTKHQVQSIVYQQLKPYAGSISAEHGIGLDKLKYLHCSRTDNEIALMKRLKLAFDPKNLLNRGKVFP
ncbi:FAD-binding oxidoreductase [Pseudomonadota bacterium]|uniref:FAD-binding oxidoreductase n=1 Tax=Shewanella sp. 10N.286.51.B8 TaxID=3229708 RepID=UPI00354DC2B1